MRLATFNHPFPFDHEILMETLGERAGRMTPTGSRFYRSLFDRTGGGSGIIPSVQAALIAVGNSQTTALVLKEDWNHIAIVAPGAGVQIPGLQIGQEIYVANDGANPLAIYPAGGWTIDAGVINAAFSLAITKMQKFRVVTRTQLRSLQLG